MFFAKNNPVLKILFNHLKFYPTPTNLSYFWNFGSLAGICLVIQIVTGVFLAMHYSAHVEYAFYSIEHIMRDVNYGWLIRYLHSNGASMFFAVVYLHIARGIFYKSYSYESKEVWISGLVILILMMATAFIGYVLPWGQMSYWGATVITNIFSAIPFVGSHLVYWLWGGFSVGAATLNRFFSLHYLLPFLIVGVVILHLAQLHEIGSSNPFPLSYRFVNNDNIFFYPYFFLKDLLGLLVFCWVYLFFVCFIPDYLGHSDNYIEANPLVTPEHIVPEWYFLPFYAILRSIPDKLGGIIFMFGSIVVFFFLPFFIFLRDKLLLYYFSFRIKGKGSDSLWFFYHIERFYLYQIIVWVFFFCFIGLGWIGANPVEEPFISIGLFLTLFYFFLIFLLILLI